MPIVVANRTAQSGTYYTGSPNYVDVSAGTAEAGMVTFSAKATDASWDDGVEIGVVVVKDDDNWQVWRATWDATNEYLEVVEVEDNAGTLSNADAVTVTATLTEAHVRKIINGSEVLTANRTYYVRTDGSDSNNGLTNTSGGAFLTVQKAIDSACAVKSNGYAITIQVGDGTYTSSGVVAELKVHDGSQIIIQGNNSTPSNVVLNSTGGNTVTLLTLSSWYIKDLKIQTSGSNSSGINSNVGKLDIRNIVFGACSHSHIYLWGPVYFNYQTPLFIAGAALHHINATRNATIAGYGVSMTLTGTPAFSASYFYAATGAVALMGGHTYSGTATGKRYDITLNAACSVGGGGATYFPGNTSGTTATGGQYA